MHAGKRAAALCAAVPLLVLATACDKDAEQARGLASTPCSSPLPGSLATRPPGDLPIPADLQVYRSDNQGQTQVFFASTKGGPGDLVAVRDKVNETLKSNGYEIEGTDQEKNAEAESEFKGPHEGTVQVRPLCTDMLNVRFTLTS